MVAFILRFSQSTKRFNWGLYPGRCLFTTIFGFAVVAIMWTSNGSAAGTRVPNLLVIMADDLGYADVGFNGCNDIATPNLDALARQSVRCTSGYVTFPVCSPSRAGLLTGRHQARFGYERNPEWAPDDKSVGLSNDHLLLPAVLKNCGYGTGCVGKWHLGAHPDLHPLRRGFDSVFGILHGGHAYLPGEITSNPYTMPLDRNGRPEVLKGHLTEVLGREAASFIRQLRGSRWFLYLAFNAPHGPLQSTPELIERAGHIADSKRRHYAALVMGLDDAIGVVLDELRQTESTSDTLIFFVSDNGGTPKSNSDNSPLRGSKGSLFEGGIRVPFLVSWPGQLPAGRDFNQPVSTLDVFPTCVSTGNGAVANELQLEGSDLLPFLTGKKTGAPHEYLYWRAKDGAEYAVRHGNWKLMRTKGELPQLFDLAEDIHERTNLAASKPEIVEKLSNAYGEWNRKNESNAAASEIAPRRKVGVP